MRAERHASLRADLALVVVSGIWGFTFPAIQLALRDAGPLSFITLRFSLAAVTLAVVFRRRAFRVSRSGFAFSVVLGVCLAAGAALQTFGLLYTTASKSAFITGLYVVLVPLVALAALRVRLRLSSGLAVVLAAAGLYELTLPGLSGYNVGDLLTLACAVAFALHIVIAEVAAPRSDPVALAFWQIVVTAVASGVVMLGAETPRFGLTPWTIVALAFTGVLATALAFVVQMWAQRETSGAHVAVIFAAEPVFAAIFARIIQDERLGAHGLIGGVLIMLGILLSQVGARERHRPRGRRR